MLNFTFYRTRDPKIDCVTDSITKLQAKSGYKRITESRFKELRKQYFEYCEFLHGYSWSGKRYHLHYYIMLFDGRKVLVNQTWNDKILFEEYNWIDSDRKQYYYQLKDNNLKTKKDLLKTQTVVWLGQLEFFVEFDLTEWEKGEFREQDIEAVWRGDLLFYTKHEIPGVHPLDAVPTLRSSLIKELVRTQPYFIYQDGL